MMCIGKHPDGMLPESIRTQLYRFVGSIEEMEPVGGGCIAHASRIETKRGVFFLKWGTEDVGRTFSAEALGLQALRAVGSQLIIPEVIAHGISVETNPGFLLLEWIESGSPGTLFWEDLGRDLAAFHRSDKGLYGFEANNFIGRTPQQNDWLEDWPSFFRTYRLQPQIQLARKQKRWPAAWDRLADQVMQNLEQWLPARPVASMLHGDLWSGNLMCTVSDKAALIDPAAYYGDREADLAMTELFGGFHQPFYAAYREAWPLEPGYEDRLELYNLYHLINHLNLFGSSYAGSVERILKRFG